MRNAIAIPAGLFDAIKANLSSDSYQNLAFFDKYKNEIVFNNISLSRFAGETGVTIKSEAIIEKIETSIDQNGDAQIKLIVNAAVAEVNKQILKGGSTHAALKARGVNMSVTKHDRVLTANPALGMPYGPVHQPYSHAEAPPLQLILHCPRCRYQHVDDESFTETHRSHLCRACNTVWRPADVPSIGVRSIETRGKADTWPSV